MSSRTPYFRDYEPSVLSPDTIESIRNCLVKHPRFGAALDQVLSHVQMGSPSRIVLVLGASGVGKTTLRHASRALIGEWVKSTNGPYGPVSMSAAPPEGSSFSFRAFYEQVLHAMNEPLVEFKMPPEERLEQLRRKPGVRINRSTASARFVLEKALIRKAPPALLIDEAQHLGRDASLKQSVKNMDVIKSLSEVGATKLILFGTLQARSLQHLNGQLSRRIKPAMLMPYELTETGHQDFWLTFVSICKHVRLSTDIGSEHAKYLHESTAGCVGILSEWLQEAAETAIGSSSKTVQIEHFQATQPAQETLDLIRTEELEYENGKSKRKRQIRRCRKKGKRKRCGENSKPGKRTPTKRDRAGESSK